MQPHPLDYCVHWAIQFHICTILCIVIMHYQFIFILLWICRCWKQESRNDVLTKTIGNSKHDIIYLLVKKCSIFNQGEVLTICRKLLVQDYI